MGFERQGVQGYSSGCGGQVMLDYSQEKAKLVIRVLRQRAADERVDLVSTLGMIARLVVTVDAAVSRKEYAFAVEALDEVDLALTRCERELETLGVDMRMIRETSRARREDATGR